MTGKHDKLLKYDNFASILNVFFEQKIFVLSKTNLTTIPKNSTIGLVAIEAT